MFNCHGGGEKGGVGRRTKKTGGRAAIPVTCVEEKHRETLEGKAVLDLCPTREVASNAGEGAPKEILGAISINSEAVLASRKRRGRRDGRREERKEREDGNGLPVWT